MAHQASSSSHLRITTWNVNSVRQRLAHLLTFLSEEKPDVLCLQEIKCQNHDFPVSDVESLGYNLYLHGQKTFNGVALISKSPLDDVIRGLDDNAEDITMLLYLWQRMTMLRMLPMSPRAASGSVPTPDTQKV